MKPFFALIEFQACRGVARGANCLAESDRRRRKRSMKFTLIERVPR
jgi:hypothetical protein